MRNRIAITALSALFAAGSLFGALAKPALADADDHNRSYQHHHAYQNANHPGWNNGQHTGWTNGRHVGWNNGNANRWNGNTNRWNGNQNRWSGDHDRDDRKLKHHHHKDTDHRR